MDDDHLRLRLAHQIECKDWRCAGDTPGVNDIDGLTSTAGEATPSRVNRFEVLYAKHYGAILAYAIRRTSTRDDAQDVVAEVFTTAWRQMDRLPGEPGDRLWLYGIARRVVARHHRGRRRRSRLKARLTLERSNSPMQAVDHEQPRIEILRLAIERLPSLDREALKLVMWDRLSHEEAARILGCSANALGVRLHRARNRLQEELAISDRITDSSPERNSDEH
jgi:RNA polymerase sigma factor (sigma-70 family)